MSVLCQSRRGDACCTRARTAATLIRVLTQLGGLLPMGLPEDRPEMSDEDWVNERLYGRLVHLPPLGLSTVSRRPPDVMKA